MRSLLLIACLSAAAVTTVTAAETTPPAPATAPADAKPFLGLRFDESAPNFASEPGLPVSELVTGATAQVLGIEIGDRILSINGKAMKNLADLQAVLGGTKVGDQVGITFFRAGSEQTVNGPLLAKPRPASVTKDLAEAQRTLDEAKELARAKAREPSLPELLQQLKDIQTGLPRAVAAFKRQYPNGTFDIRISVTICSDSTAKDPIEFTTESPKADTKTDAKPAPKAEPAPAPGK